MGNRGKKKLKKWQRIADMDSIMDEAEEAAGRRVSVKQLSKKKKRKQQALEYKNKHHVTLSKEHKWYQVKVYDTSIPSKEFLEESFKSMIDTPFIMLGYHKSTNSARFFLEDNASAALAMEALTKRMLGMEGKLMQIAVQPCSRFILLNPEGIKTVQQVLANRFSNDMLDLTNFHHDSVFLSANILPVLSEDLIFRQVLKIIKEHLPNIKMLNLSRNNLRLQHIKVLASTLKESPLERICLEHNKIENLRGMVKTLSVFERIVELKLDGNGCLGDIKDPVVYIRTVKSQFPALQVLDGKDIETYLAEKTNPLGASTSTAASSSNSTVATPAGPRVEESVLNVYLEQFYVCIDSEQRLELVNAFTSAASVKIESEVSQIPSGVFTGSAQIKEMLALIPRTKHSNLSLKMIKIDPSVGQVEVSGKLAVEGADRQVDFLHQLNIIPYNTGLGCSIMLMKFK